MSVFISYEWFSAELVHQTVNYLETKYNQKIWIDKIKIKPGENLHKEIQTGINNSEIVVAFVTMAYCIVFYFISENLE